MNKILVASALSGLVMIACEKTLAQTQTIPVASTQTIAACDNVLLNGSGKLIAQLDKNGKMLSLKSSHLEAVIYQNEDLSPLTGSRYATSLASGQLQAASVDAKRFLMTFDSKGSIKIGSKKTALSAVSIDRKEKNAKMKLIFLSKAPNGQIVEKTAVVDKCEIDIAKLEAIL